ncbi:2-keto-3-deoxygluconate permease [Companilactobacillus tucceti DSM 20183]|uniref:2-keto-3-deoxygluconate permease n=1 Tax=Companilactobacillus tucceti DSM 20183 TaxID=1423811 RepID=A0A0R1J5R6_9LACO|nr:2-keto-3-deoxygluconate permease [Companilactobacillus tucceti]KRK64163.1 2-keto-3-deoxygluconate permease [Companilactobacillus tucceti DSM 20183]
MQIKKGIEKIPGGMMVVPLFLGTLTNTLWPGVDKFYPGFTGNFLVGTSVILFMFFFSVGTTIDLKSTGYIAKKGLSLLIVKVLLAGLLGVIINQFLPRHGVTTGLFAGFSVLAVIASFNETNGGLYMALMTTLNRDEDAAGFPFISIESGPFMTMVTMGVAGIAQFPWQALVSTLIPFAIGITLGSLDHSFRKMFKPVVPAMVPFFAFTLGYSLNFGMIFKSGFMGIFMGVIVVLVSGSVLALVDRFFTGSDGVAGWAASSTAGAAVAVPYAIAETNPSFSSTAASATAIVATSVLVTSILTPIVTMYMEKRARRKGLPIVPKKYEGKFAESIMAKKEEEELKAKDEAKLAAKGD